MNCVRANKGAQNAQTLDADVLRRRSGVAVKVRLPRAAVRRLDIMLIDVSCVFLYGEMEINMHIELPTHALRTAELRSLGRQDSGTPCVVFATPSNLGRDIDHPSVFRHSCRELVVCPCG